MSYFDSAVFDIRYLDTLSYKDSVIHRLDPRVKLVVTVFYILAVVSFPKYELAGLVPFFIFPVVLVSLADLPVGLLARKMIAVSPFAILVGIANPLFDQQVVFHLGSLPVTGGWISFASILLRFIFTVSAALILIATTSFPGICFALKRLKVPRALVVQLHFLYHFIFVLMDEALRMVRARDMRALQRRGAGVKVYVHLLGTLLLRTMDRAERVHQAMFSRAFNGRFYVARGAAGITRQDGLFFVAWTVFFILCRSYNISQIIGQAALKGVGMIL